MKAPKVEPEVMLRALMTGAALWKTGRMSIETLTFTQHSLQNAAGGIIFAAQGAREMVAWKGGHDPAILQVVRSSLSRFRLLFSFLAAQPKTVRLALDVPMRLLGQAIADLDSAFTIDPFMN